MKLLILGGSNIQLNTVKKAKNKGHTVIVSDYYEDAPAKQICDYGEPASTFNVEANIEVAERYGIDGVLTMGTDQPVYTVARVADKCGLPALVGVDTAKAATNKKMMKAIFMSNDIPTVDYRTISCDFTERDIEGISFPVVVKPLDSQGQRGVYKLDSIEGIRGAFDVVLSFSREKEILVEEYYPSDEITVSGWVSKGRLFLLTITDRICYNNYPHIGICIAHDFPSKHMKQYYFEIESISRQITKAFNILEGPVYFQMLIGNQGIKVNEIACRIGGAYEDEFIPLVTGVDISDMLIEASLGRSYDIEALEGYSLEDNSKLVSVEMIFAAPCVIKEMNDMNRLKLLPGVVQAVYNFKPGHVIESIKNATARAGYVIITGENQAALRENRRRVYENLEIIDDDGENRIIDSCRGRME
ncbi:MAG: ATP-grasp domain-containing protein [Pseudomonadota bacterium]